jgi:hypothetical protein
MAWHWQGSQTLRGTTASLLVAVGMIGKDLGDLFAHAVDHLPLDELAVLLLW